MRLILTNKAGSFDVTELVTTVRWSGAVRQCARMLSFGLLGVDGAPDCSPGCQVSMSEGGRTLFTGILVERTASTADHLIDCTAYDFGLYLNRNQASKKFAGVTPEAATAELAAEFGIATGTLAATGVAVTRKFFGKSLYEIIMTMYTEASKATGKFYFVSFTGATLSVLEKGAAGSILVVKGGSNLIDAATTESIANIVNRVAVYDADENPLYVKADDASTSLYGVMQRVVKRRKDQDEAAEVEKLLKAAEPEQKITVNCLGDASCVTGGSIIIHEPVTNLYGRFYIDADVHQWKNGVYTNKLTLNLNAVMDEKSAGEAVKEAAGKGGTGSTAGYQQALDNLHNKTMGGS